MRFMSDKCVPRSQQECFVLPWGKEAIGKLEVKLKEFFTGLGDEGCLSSHVKQAIPTIHPWAFPNLFPVCRLQAMPADVSRWRY